MKSLSRVRLLATLWTVAYQAPPSVGFSRQEYWSGVPLPSPNVVLVSTIQQSESAISIYPLPLKPPYHSPPCQHSRSSQGTKLSFLCFPLTICFTHGGVYMSMLFSQFIPPSHFPTVSASLFSTSVSLFLPYNTFISTISLDYIYMG